MACECEGCKFLKQVAAIKARLNDEDSVIIEQLIGKMIHESDDAGYWQRKYDTARASAFTEAAQAMCVHCKKGLSGDKQFNHFVDDGLQPRGEKGRIVRCFAAPIWNIASQAEKGK